MHARLLATAFALGLALLPAAHAAGPLHLSPVVRVPLSGPAVRFDYTSFDPSTHLLWISHMDADELLAFDVRTRKIARTVSAPGVHGVIAVPQLGRVFASATNVREVLML